MVIDVSCLERPDGLETLVRTLSEKKGLCIVLGATDTGKSCLTRLLLRGLLDRGLVVALVDADLGQSSLGLPTTVSYGLFSSQRQEWKPDAMCFVGSVSAEGRRLEHISSILRLARLGKEDRADVTLVDTTGAVGGPSAQLLKAAKMDVLAPDLIVALQRKTELEPILRVQELLGRRVVRVPVVRAAKRREREERALYRAGAFAEYFARPATLTFPLEKFLHCGRTLKMGQRITPEETKFAAAQLGTRVVWGDVFSEEAALVVESFYSYDGVIVLKDALAVRSVRIFRECDLINLLVGLTDVRGLTPALGIVESLSWENESVTVTSPFSARDEIVAVQTGSIRIRATGEEVGRVPREF